MELLFFLSPLLWTTVWTHLYDLPYKGNISVEKLAGIFFAPSGATHFSAIAIRNAYPGIAPTAQKNCFYYSTTDILLLKEQLFFGNSDVSTQ